MMGFCCSCFLWCLWTGGQISKAIWQTLDYEINILWWGRCKGMPILGVCWKFLFVGMNYHLFPDNLSLSSLFASFGDGRFWAHHQLLSWHCGCNKSCFGRPTSCFVWKSLEANIPHPSFFGTDTMVWILPTLKGMFLLENPRPRGMETSKTYEFFLEWIIFQHGGDFLPVRRL